MIDSSTAYKKAIRESGRIMSIHDEYTFANGEKPDIDTGSFTMYSVNEATSDSSSFSIGATVIKKYTASLNNIEGRFDDYDFEGLDIVARVGLKLPDESVEIIPKGKYRCVNATFVENTINVEGYDSMLFFDRPYSESTLAYPTTILKIVEDACVHCQMTFNAKTIRNGDFVVQERPDDSNITFRDIIGYCAQIMCCYAIIDKLDQLAFEWYDFSTLEKLQNGYNGGTFSAANTPYSDGDTLDGGIFTDYSSGDGADGGTFEELKSYHHLYSLGSQSINTDDICITGIAIKPVQENSGESEIYLYGEDTYALSLEDNPLIQSMESAEVIAIYIGEKMVGKKFRPLSISCQSDPCMEAGDCACVTDRKQRTFYTVITNTTFSFGSSQTVECTAETPTEKNYTKYSAATKLLKKANKAAEKKLSTYDLAVQQLTNLMTQSFGVFKSEEVLEDGSVIYYMHNKPERANSSTIWKMTADAFAVSTDGGKTWNAGIDSSGNEAVNVLSAIGINFDWAHGGTLTLGGSNNGNGILEVVDENGKAAGRWDKDGIILPDNTVIQWSQVNGAEDQVTKITKNTVTTEYVNTLKITAGSVAAENITGETITGKTITGGSIIGNTISNGNGTFNVDENGRMDASDVHVTGGTIGGMNIYTSKDSGSSYLETIPGDTGLTSGIGNNGTWSLWAGYDASTQTASFWVTESGEIHMKDWLYGTSKEVWAMWSKTNGENRYGVNYIYGDWIDNTMYIRFVFYDHVNKKRGYVTLPVTGWTDGEPE